MVGIGALRVFIRTKLNIEPYSQLKPTKVGFIFIGPNSLCRAKDVVAVNYVTQAVVMSWVEDWVLKSGLRNYGSSRNFLIAGSVLSGWPRNVHFKTIKHLLLALCYKK